MKKVAIIDYAMGNLDSVARAIEECRGEPVITGRAEDLKEANYIILPGVGAFGDGMRNIRELGLEQTIKEEVLQKEIPFLGICLGMQLLASRGYEDGETAGLDLIPGEVVRFEPDGPGVKVPHIGWNEVVLKRPHPLFRNIPSEKDFYFVHSYHFACKNREDILCLTPYCGNFVSAVNRKNVIGVQFHPEKSLQLGLKLLSNFLSL
ncbi:MAG: imidazole glycerol phosphate synthase subunit HisH [Deltaproteobacteria bacterium]|nr:imidazole glycerol phosphate synthase subunit HisH [Deltaproteobacteria bacterium]